MSNSRKKEKKSFFDVSLLDIFGEPVSLKFDGRNTYTTKVGGVISLLFFLQVLYLMAIKLRALSIGKEVGQLTT